MAKNITNTIISVILMLMLSYCDNRQQSVQTEGEIDTNAVVLESEEATIVGTDTDTTGAYVAQKLTVSDIIAFELKVLKNEYEYHRPFFINDMVIPNCEQCSDLEQLLILERNIDSFKGLNKNQNLYPYNGLNDPVYIDIPIGNIMGTSYLTTKNEAIIKDKLRDVESAYEKKFSIPAPWWWICSVEERITRLEKAIKTNKEYPDYPGANDRWYYMLGKTMAAYEMWFKRPLPVCTQTSCITDVRQLNHAKTALVAGLPYLSEKEDALLKNRLKAEYKKKQTFPYQNIGLQRLNNSERVFKVAV